MLRRRFLWIIAAVLVPATIATGVVWLDQESTLAAAARVAVERSHGTLVLDRVSGTLLRRIHVDHAMWRTGGREVVVDDTTLDWSPLWLLLATASFHDVHVGNATVTVAEAQAAPLPPTLPDSLRLPLRLRIHDTTVDRLTFVRDGVPREVSRLAFDGEAGWQTWALSINESATPLGRLRGRMEIGATAPYPVSGKLGILRDGAAPLALEVTASGALAHTVEVKATLRAQSSEADATLVFAPLEAQPIARADATLRTLDLRHLLASAPEAVFDGRLTATSENGELRGDVTITNRVPGTVDAGRVPLATVAARIDGGTDALVLDGIAVDLGNAGRMSGRGRVSADEFGLRLDGEQLNLRAAHSALEPTQFIATIETGGDLRSQNIRATFTQRAYRATFDGTLAADAVTVRQARVTMGNGFAEAKGRIGLDPEYPYQLNATLSHFDPSRLGKFQRASLNARINATGSIQPTVQVHAAIEVAPSTAFGLPTTAKAQWQSRGVDDPQIAIDGNATIGETKIAVKGRLVNPEDLRSLDLTLALSGRDLAQLYPITGLPFPSTPEYRIDGRLQYDDHVWSFRRFSGSVGRSDLAGDLVVDRHAAKPFMRAALMSQRLDMRDLAGFIGASEAAPPKPPGRVLPRGEFHLDKLNAANADVQFTGERIRNENLPLNRMTTHLVLRNGVLTLDPLTFGAAVGNIGGKVTIDATKPTIMAVVDITGEQFRLERFAPGVKQVLQEAGPISGRVRLTMHGSSLAAMLATADGDIALAMTGGRISDLTLRLADLDIANALAVMARDKNRSVAVNCVIGDFVAENGVLKPRALVLDAEHTTATAEGRIDLRAESLDLRVVAKPKQFSAFALRGPIVVDGTLGAPSVHVDWRSAIARGGAAAALGVIATPPAAALPFVQFGSSEAFSCAPRVDAISALVREQRSASVKAG